jgi:hypothetical protein
MRDGKGKHSIKFSVVTAVRGVGLAKIGVHLQSLKRSRHLAAVVVQCLCCVTSCTVYGGPSLPLILPHYLLDPLLRARAPHELQSSEAIRHVVLGRAYVVLMKSRVERVAHIPYEYHWMNDYRFGIPLPTSASSVVTLIDQATTF